MPSSSARPHHERRWLILAVLGLAQLMVILDVTVVNIALLHDQARTADPKLDLHGTVTAVLGLVALVYGFSQAETDGWGAPTTLGFIATGLVLLTAFVALQRRVAHPLLPLRVVLDRNRGGAFIALATNSAALMAVFLFLTYYLQQNLGMSPVETGLAFLPSPIVVALASMQLAPRAAARLGARLPIAAGMALAAVGMVLLAQLDAGSSYLTGVVPGLVVMSLGLGCVMGLAMGTATFGVDPADRRRRRRHRQHDAAGRRLARHRPAQHPRHQRHDKPALGRAPHAGARRRRQRPRLQHRVLVVSRAAGPRRPPVLGAHRKPQRPARDRPRRHDRPAGRGPLTHDPRPKEPR